jgi:pimeloyl-ACP methyl ester carboxylesterase
MANEIDRPRRRFLRRAAVAVAAARLGLVGAPRARAAETSPAGPAPARPAGNASFPRLQQIDAGVLNIGYAEVGDRAAAPVILLHGWPYDIHSYVDVAPSLAASGYRVIVPYLRGYGMTRFLSRQTFRNAQQAAVALDVIALMDALHIDKAILGGFDWGSRTAAIVAALWPKRCKALVAVSGYLVTNRKMERDPLPPAAELGWWYQYYLATERGRAGYDRNRRDFNRLIWKSASPRWAFDDATYDRTAAAFDNPDHVAIVVHNYRWRLGLAEGEARYDALERKLAEAPVIAVPAITIASDFDGARADGKAYASKFSGRYTHRILQGIGHDVPQEAPEAFAQAVIDADHLEA